MGAPGYLATLADGTTRIVPVDGDPIAGFSPERITEFVTNAAGPNTLAEIRTIDQYDMYYLDRLRERPLPVVLARMNDEEQDARTTSIRRRRVCGQHLQLTQLDEPLGLSRPPLTRLPVALQLPSALGHRRHHVHAAAGRRCA
jgi:hypothetical protein